MNNKWTTDNIPDLTGKVIIVTGANQGLGFETSKQLAANGAKVVLAVRSIQKGEDAIKKIKAEHPNAILELIQIDLASLESIRIAAEKIKNRFVKIDVLINNAGVMYAPISESADGLELQLGTNHFGHFALTGLLLIRLINVPESRIVTVSSLGHRLASKTDFTNLKSEERLSPPAAYNRSKLANLFFHYELQRRLFMAKAETIAVATHPGLSNTTLLNQPKARFLKPFLFWMKQSPEKGALCTLRAATDPDVLPGQFYGPDGFQETKGNPIVLCSNNASYDGKTQRLLWEISEELTGVNYNFKHK